MFQEGKMFQYAQIVYYYLNFRQSACFEQGVPWDSGIYRV